ncbi:MAG: hypothetical protein M3N08_04705, partial [Pseudomonadota bacterium]|nr:hypothetical protein [Pseudomonadota bacterium]
IIGIKPLAPGGRFPENGLARFSVIAVGADGRRRDADDLSYQVYEEGRSFAWYQAEGRWNYKPLQQKRRMGGGALHLDAQGDDRIEWPVATGTYRLEITDADGNLRSVAGFGAGWGRPDEAPALSDLSLTPSPALLQPEQEEQVRFTLEQPTMVTAFIGDDHIRKILHEFKPKGENTIAFVPGKDWTGPVTLRIEAEARNRAGQITLPLGPREVREKLASKNARPDDAIVIKFMGPDRLMEGDLSQAAFEAKSDADSSLALHVALSVSPELKLNEAGSAGVTLAPLQSKAIPFALEAVHAGDAVVKAEVTGPNRLHSSRASTLPVLATSRSLAEALHWSVAPRQTWRPPVDKAHAKPEDSLLFLSAAPLFDTPQLLPALLSLRPFTTAEITGTLEALRLWREPITTAGLLSDAAFAQRQKDLLLHLLARQKPDGGFSRMPDEGPDIVSTSQALAALAHAEPERAKAGVEQAATWLQHQLENTWLDEQERAGRAAAYAALAEADHVDNASLNYFADTSADKGMSPLAAAQLAYAFSKLNDQGKAAFWLDVAGAKKLSANEPVAILPFLAKNVFFDAQLLWPVMESASQRLVKLGGQDPEDLTGFLSTMRLSQQRRGAWRVTVDTDKRNPKDLLALFVPAKAGLPSIHNAGDEPVFASRVLDAEPGPAVTPLISRHIYQLNGTEMVANKALTRGETYLVVLEGPWAPDKASGLAGGIFIHDELAPSLRAAGCLPPAPVDADNELDWLKNQTLTPLASCETWDGGIDMFAAKREGTTWRAAYLAKAMWSGAFTLASPSARNPSLNHEPISGAKTRVKIR